MKDKALVEENYINFSHLRDFAGTIINYGLHILDAISSDTWIGDTGASNPLCTILKLLSNPVIQ